MINIERVTLEPIDGIVVYANSIIGSDKFDAVNGLADSEGDLMTAVLVDMHYVKWSSVVTPADAQHHIAAFDVGHRHRRFHIDREHEDQSNLNIGRRAFGRHVVADAVEMHSEAGKDDPVIVWRRPLEDEIPYNRFIA